MNIFGLQLDSNGLNHQHLIRGILFLLIGFSLLICNLAINCVSFKYDVRVKIFEDDGKPLETRDGKIRMSGPLDAQSLFLFFSISTIDHFFQILVVSGNHLLFFSFQLVTNKWKNIWSLLMLIQQEMHLNETFYRKCRKRCLLCLGLFCLNYCLALMVHFYIV